MRFNKLMIILIMNCLVGLAAAQTGNWGLGPHLFVSLPQSGFDNLSRDGEGIGVKAFYRFNNDYLSLRGDFAYLSYGERREAQMVNIGYGLITRRNESFQFTLGPQGTIRSGRMTLYAAGMAGIYNYRTVVTYEDYYSYYPYSDTSSSQTKWGWNGSAGLLIDLGIGPHMDLGFKYQRILDVKTSTGNGSYQQDASDYAITLGVVFFVQ